MTNDHHSSRLPGSARLSAVHQVLRSDSTARATFDRLALLAARVLRAPVAQVNIITEDRQISVSSWGPGAWAGPRDVPLDYSYCRHVVASGKPLLVEDAREHPLVHDNPATHESGIVAYAAVPLTVADDVVLGTLCVLDFVSREWSEEEIELLRSLGEFVIAEVLRGGRAEAEPPHSGDAVSNVRDVTAVRAAEERLRQSQKLEAIGHLAGGIAHDFNNVLAVIKGRAQIALMDLPEDSAVRGDLVEINRAADRAGSLTHQLLAFSRQQAIQVQVLDLNTIISDVQKMLGRILGEDIDLVTVLDPRLGCVEADPGQIEQILMNLAVNARDAMPTGGKLITETKDVELSEAIVERYGYEVEPGPFVMLSVSDTGTGMSREIRERIFEPFFTTKRQGEGTGMGLSTVYGIVKQSRGYIGVHSEEESGCTFEIYLPRVTPATPTPEPVRPQSGVQHNATILLVEDDVAVRSTTRRILERMGHTVLEACNGVEALQVAATYTGEIDLLLTDVVMPLMGGRELVERLGREHLALRVLYTSGYTDEAVMRRGGLEGGAALLQKPYQPAALAEKLAEVLARPGGRE